MKYGINVNLFQSELPRFDYAEEILKHVQDGDFIFAIKECDTRCEILIIKRVNEFKYTLFPKPIVFHSRVGATGANQLCSTYRFLKILCSEREADLNSVHFITEKLFSDLIEGKCFPGIVMNFSAQQKMYILYDFLNIAGENRTEDYQKWYGSEFVNA